MCWEETLLPGIRNALSTFSCSTALPCFASKSTARVKIELCCGRQKKGHGGLCLQNKCAKFSDLLRKGRGVCFDFCQAVNVFSVHTLASVKSATRKGHRRRVSPPRQRTWPVLLSIKGQNATLLQGLPAHPQAGLNLLQERWAGYRQSAVPVTPPDVCSHHRNWIHIHFSWELPRHKGHPVPLATIANSICKVSPNPN